MPELVLELNGQTWTLDPTRSYRIGRDPQGDLVLQDARVSWHHATIRWAGQGWVVEDHGSTNGTYAQGQRIQQLPLAGGSVVHLGNATDGPRLNFSGAAVPSQQQATYQAPAPAMAGPPPGTPPQQPGFGGHPAAPAGPPPQGPPVTFGGATSLHDLAVGQVTRIGRALENELVVSDLQVSRFHAEFLAHRDGRFEIHDLGSHNGTYVNGQLLPRNGRQYLGQNDTVGIGHSTFRLVGSQLQEFVDTGEVSFSARHLTVKVNNDQLTILNDVSFGVPEKSLIGVIGPSGSGKSTLLRALTGYRPATYGEVLYDHRNLYTHFAELRHRIGLVPQDDILHTALPIRTALRLAAKLRFPGDVGEAERNARVEEVLAELKLSPHATKRISSLSGGQRKRVSVALELLTKPSLIFLDEPTSGLDPGMDRDVMQLLRALADDGRTVLVVTHSVAELGLCDRVLVMAPGGGVAYFGPPDEALNFFGYETWADVFSAFEEYRDFDWMGRWRGSQHYQMYAADLDAVQPQAAQFQPMVMAQQKAQTWGSQVRTLMRRYAAVIMADRGFLGLTLALPIVLGLVSVVIPADHGLGPGPQIRNGDASIILLVLVVGMCFSGAANAVRELIKERVIYERERAVGLSRSAYLMSKVFVLGIVTMLQAGIMAAIGFAPRDMPPEGLVLADAPAVEMTIVLMVLGLTSMMIGLVISALVRTSEMTMPLLVMISVVQLVFTGALFQVHGTLGVEQLAWLMPSRWALGGLGSTTALNWLTAPPNELTPQDPDPLWTNDAGTWFLDVGMLLLLAVACGFLVMRFLRRHEPEVMRK